MRFFKAIAQINQNIPLLTLIEIGGYVSFSIWQFQRQFQEKKKLQEENPGKKLVTKPEKGPFGCVWKWSIQDTVEPSGTKTKPS